MELSHLQLREPPTKSHPSPLLQGVLCEHRQAAWYALAKAAAEKVDQSSTVLLTAAVTFDPCQVGFSMYIAAVMGNYDTVDDVLGLLVYQTMLPIFHSSFLQIFPTKIPPFPRISICIPTIQRHRATCSAPWPPVPPWCWPRVFSCFSGSARWNDGGFTRFNMLLKHVQT